MSNVELVKVNVVQKHVDAAKVVGGEVDFLPVEPLAHVVLAEDFCRLEQERARAARWVVHLVDSGFAGHGNAREQL